MIINSNTQIQSLNFNSQRTSTTFTKSNSRTNISQGEVKITSRNEYHSKQRALVKEIRNEYYSQAVAVDRTFANPKKHISDKYQNSDSPYFRTDLTAYERNTAYENERMYLESGDAAGYSYDDPFIVQTVGYVNVNDEKAIESAFNRQQVNGQFEQLLKNNNIIIPDDTKLRFTIDPNTKKVEVSGTDNIQLISALEEVLDEDNGKELFHHIMRSEWGNNTQFSSEKEKKYSISSSIKEETGYNLNKLEVVDGMFVTEDGTDIIDLFKQGIEDRTDIQESIKSVVIGDMYNELKVLAEKGFDSIPDLVLSIDFENGSFRDVGQSKSFATGETDWIVDKAASIQREKISAQIKELLEIDNITIPEGTNLTFNINSDSNKVEVSGIDDRKLITLLESLLNEDNAKELFLYIILDQVDKDTQLTYDIEDLVKNGFDLMKGQTISIDYKNGSLRELKGNTDWINNIKKYEQNLDIYV